jgi:glycosyltransferase A (GT-A) superfamily protein (DUF2064 family)
MIAAALVMATAPRPGEALPGLEPLLGPDGCAALQARLLARAARLAAEASPGSAYVAVDPPEAAELLDDLVGEGVQLLGQDGRNRGERLRTAVAEVQRRGDGPVVVFGTAAPALDGAHLQAAREVLWSGHDVAVGPTFGGGWYLLALARPAPGLFDLPPAAWGGDRVLGLTLRAARAAGLSVGMVEPERELESPDDVAELLAGGELPEEVAALLRVPSPTPPPGPVAFPPTP